MSISPHYKKYNLKGFRPLKTKELWTKYLKIIKPTIDIYFKNSQHTAPIKIGITDINYENGKYLFKSKDDKIYTGIVKYPDEDEDEDEDDIDF